MPLLAAGVAFWAFFAIMPALAAVVSVYGLVTSPQDVQRQLSDYGDALPVEARSLLQDQLDQIVSHAPSALSIGFVVFVALALWSASSGVRYLLDAVGVIAGEDGLATEPTGFVRARARALLVTLAVIAALIVALALLAGLPPLVDEVTGGRYLLWLRWPLLLAGMTGFVSFIHRLGAPRRAGAARHHGLVTPGVLAAVGLWLIASVGLTVYTSLAGRLGQTYGTLTGVIVLMLWLWLSVLAILAGMAVDTVRSEYSSTDDG